MKNIFRFLMAVAVLFTASCAKEDISSSIGGGEVEVTFSASLPELGTRAYGNGANATLLRYYVFDAANGAELEALRGTATRTSGNFTFTLPLLKGMKYNIALWADKNLGTAEAPQGFYAFDGKVVTVDYVNANDNNRDAFYHYEPNFDPTDPRTTTFTLYRPFAQLNAAVVNSDIEAVAMNGVTLETSTVEVTTYTQFNLATGDVVDSSETEVNFTATDMPYEASEELKSGYTYLSMNYILAPKAGSVSDVTFTFNNNKGVDFGATYTNVPLKQNYRTNILGKLLTATTEFTVEILPGFDGTETVNVWDGKTVTPPAYDADSKTYTVTNGAELAWVAAAANGTTRSDVDTFIGQTIVLANDIELGGHNWTPISISTELGNGKTFRGTFDGNYKTISGLVSNQKEIAGLFGYIYAATIKNVTIKGASINSNHYAGGIVAWLLNNSGNVQIPAIIENCHVVNSTITSTPELVNGEWDNGDKAGGLVGYACFDNANNERGAGIKNCSVENTTIKAYRDFGGLVGYASYVALTNCSVNNITLEQDLTHDYKAPNTPTTYGELIGRNDGGNTIDGGQFVADGVTKHNNDYYLSNAAGLFWLAGEVNKYDNYERPFEGVTVYLTTDINLQGAEWIPIGDYRFSANRFCGTFDGQNHTVSNFKISKNTDKNDDNKSSYGFFGNVEGTIKNLTIDDASVNAYAYTAILVGRLTNGTLENCHVKNSSVVNSYWQAGGLVGQQNEVCNIKNCSVDNVTVQSKSCVGLLVGPMTNGEKNPATVSTIEDCSVKNSQIIQSGSFGSEHDKLFGVINPDVDFNNNTLNINNFTSENNSFNRIGVNTDLALYAGLKGNVFIDGVCVSAYGLTIVDGYTALFTNDAGDYCLLNKQSLIDWYAFLTKDTTRNPYDCNVKMLADIDADGWTWNSLWINAAANNLTGLQFDGQGHTISNLNIAGEGMFSATLAGMAFKNLTIDRVNVASTGHNAAVFAGAAYSSVSFENVAVKNATINGPCNTGIFVGGTYIDPIIPVITFKNCSVETSAVTAAGKDGQDPTGASGFVGKAYGSTKLVFEGTNSIDDATTITNHNGLVGGKAYGYTIWANGGWASTGASDEFVSWGGLSYVSDAAALTEALKNGGTVVLSQDVKTDAATAAPYGNKYGFKLDGGVLDGNGNELEVECYGDDYGVMTSGGTVKNLTIKKGCRAIMIMSPTEDIILDNVNIGGNGVLYPINTGEAGAEGIKLVVTNSTLAGWVSFSNIASASFTNVKFEHGTYYNNIYGRVLKPYVNTTITDCSFVAHMNLDLSKLTSGHKITFKNCTVDGQAINAGVFTVPTTDAQYDTELFTVDLPAWASSINDCIVFE